MRPRRATPNTPAAGSLASSPPHAGTAGHGVHFYESEDVLYDAVARYLGDGLRRREPLLVLATSDRRDAFLDKLHRQGHDPRRLLRRRNVTFADADETLDRIMDGSMPDEGRFRRTVGSMVEQARQGGRPVRAYGELVDVLWRQGNPAAAVRLEELWNELARTHSFSLFCAYSLGHFASVEDAERFRVVCDLHTHVEPAPPLLENPVSSGREIAELQQRAASLESELQRRRELEAVLREALRERRQAERALRAAVERAESASRAKSDFLAVMSHELRTPLNAIIGYDELLAMEVSGPVNDRQRGYVDRIRGAAQQLLGLIDQILTLSRVESGNEHLDIETVDATAVIDEAVAMVEPLVLQRGLTLAAAHPPAPVHVATDAGKLRQILLNLLANAVKFTASGGIEVALETTSDAVHFAVRDTGPGVPAADAERIFQRFVQGESGATRSAGGTGLGLSVSRDLARLMGGDVLLHSTPGRGSTFTLVLPQAATSVPGTGPATPNA